MTDSHSNLRENKIKALALYELAMRRHKAVLTQASIDPDNEEMGLAYIGAQWAFGLLKKAVVAELEDPEPKET